MKLIEKIKKFLRLPQKCSTCRHWEHMYDRFGDCRLLSRQDNQVMEDCEHVCSLYERKEEKI